jgi:predicted RNase H-like HicB family nuclease
MREKRKFTVLIERDENGVYIGSVPALKACYTEGESIEVLMERVREVVELCLEEDDKVEPLEFVETRQITI